MHLSEKKVDINITEIMYYIVLLLIYLYVRKKDFRDIFSFIELP